MSTEQRNDFGFAVAVQLIRFGILYAGVELLPLLGFTPWWTSFTVNVLCCVYAAVLMSVLRLWQSSGMLTGWRSWRAALLLVPLVVEALAWGLPDGIVPLDPGYGWWALTLLLVGFNEELVSRGVVLSRLARSFTVAAAVTISAVLFGLQHLSAFALNDNPAGDVLWNVLYTGIYGFALAAFQVRFAWLWPLVIVHALSDFAGILSPGSPGDAVVIPMHLGLIAFGILLLRWRIGPHLWVRPAQRPV